MYLCQLKKMVVLKEQLLQNRRITMIEIEIIAKQRKSKYNFLKSRKEFLEREIKIYRDIDFISDSAKRQILIGLSNELQNIQIKIDDLIWG